MFDFHKRCVVRHAGYDRLFYGLSTDSYVTAGLDGVPESEPADYAHLSRGGRRPGQPERQRQHFFNKRIMTDDERIGGRINEDQRGNGERPLRSANHRDGEQTPDAGRGVQGTGQVAFPATVAGGSAGGAAADHEATEGEPESKIEEGNQEEVT